MRRGAITHVDTITEITAVSNEGYAYTITRGKDGGKYTKDSTIATLNINTNLAPKIIVSYFATFRDVRESY